MSNYTSFSTAETNPDLDIIEDVSPDEVNAKKESLTLIDVRGADEYVGELGHIADSKLITLDTLMDHIDDIPKDKTVVFVCRSGRRSANATAIAKDNGFESAFNMKGGMMLWNEMGLATEGKSSE
ncbi:MAG: rhodanese-like domain-containing protein [Pseudomonadota bacterium]